MSEFAEMMGSLRTLQELDLEMILRWRNDFAVRQNMYTSSEIPWKEHVEWWQRIKSSESNLYFVYELRGSPFGVVSFNNIDCRNKNASWAFYAAPEAPVGVGSRMEFLALDYAFDALCLHRLSCEVLSFNQPVIKLHEKFGFQVEGVFRERYLRDDFYYDVFCLGQLSKEWLSHRQIMAKRLKRAYGRENER